MDIQNKNTIDVVIPVYNGENFIQQAIESVLLQDLKPNKIIIVNDGSTDNTSDIILKLTKNSPVEIILIEQKNKGLSVARNSGIKASTADFIAFLDHDDIWFQNKLSSQIEVFNNSNIENLGLVYCQYANINNQGEKIPDEQVISIDPTNRGPRLFKKNLNKNIIISSGSGVLIKSECFKNVGLFEEKLTAFEDFDMWLRIINKYSIDYSNKVLVGIRTHNTNMQKNYKHMFKNQILFYKKWFIITLFKKPQIILLWFLRLTKVFIKSLKNTSVFPKVSVIMPVYNSEKYILETLNSLICQSEFIKELIIINDGSTDSSRTIIEDFISKQDKKEIIKLLDNKFLKGIAGSRNTGLEIAKGEYIALADSDDIYTRNRLEEQEKFLDTHEKIDIVGSSFITFEENKKGKKIYRPIFSTLTAFFMVSDMSLCHPSVMFRRSVLKTIPEYPNVKVEDFAFFSKLLKKHRAKSTLKSFIYYRRHPASYSIDLNKSSLANNSKDIFKDNLIYYTGEVKDEDIFFHFLRKRNILLVNLKTVIKISNQILIKIKRDHKMSYYNFDFVLSLLYIYILMVICTLRPEKHS